MSVPLEWSRQRIRPSVSQRDIIPDLGIAAFTVALTAFAYWMIVLGLGNNSPLFLFAASSAALTFWRGFGPGMLASSLGSWVGPLLSPVTDFAGYRTNIQLETLLLCAGSMFTCWLIYRLRVQQEDTQVIQKRRNDALAFVSHELRQPLSNIKFAAALLESDQSELTRTRATRLILRSATRLGAVISDVTDVTRLQANAIRIDPRLMRLEDAILVAVDATRPDVEGKHQSLEIDVPLEPPLWIVGDAMRLEQVFDNVLANASRYSPEGAKISVSSRQEHGWAVVIVRDTGIGISPDMLETIFDPFVRERGGADGLGIGLTLARNVLTRHGGKIEARSEGPGCGSTFIITLPLSGESTP